MKSLWQLLIAATFFGALILYWHLNPPTLPIGTANGSYSHPCCGTITLRDGAMRWLGNEASYLVEYDKGGRYVLLQHGVAISSGGLSIERQSYPLKMRLQGSQVPEAIEILDVHTGLTYDFERVGG